jgi:hypothetical protein
MNRYLYVRCVDLQQGGIIEDCEGKRFEVGGAVEIVGRFLCVVGRVLTAFGRIYHVEFRCGRRAWVKDESPVWYEPPKPGMMSAEAVQEILYELGRKAHGIA